MGLKNEDASSFDWIADHSVEKQMRNWLQTLLSQYNR